MCYFVVTLLLDAISVFLQAQCWPNCMKILGSWYPDKVRNSVFGIFGTCAFVGGIVGTALAVSTYFYVFFSCCMILWKNRKNIYLDTPLVCRTDNCASRSQLFKTNDVISQLILKIQGPVVQSLISLTSSLRVISLTVLADSIYNILIFFAEKMWVAFEVLLKKCE